MLFNKYFFYKTNAMNKNSTSSHERHTSIKDMIYEVLCKALHKYQLISKIFFLILSIFLIVWIMPRTTKFKYEYQKMKPWQYKSLYAPFNFSIYKTAEQLKIEENEVLKDFHPIFVYDNSATNKHREEILADFENKWTGSQEDKSSNKLLLEKLYDTIENVGIIENISSLSLKPESTIKFVRDRLAKTIQVDELYTMTSVKDSVFKFTSNTDENIDKDLINKLLLNHLHQNIIYSEDKTKQDKEQAMSKISLTFGMVQKDELIINEGELVTEEKYNILNSLRTEYEKNSDNNFSNSNLILWGQILFITMVFICLLYGLNIIYPKINQDVGPKLLIYIVMLMMIIPSFIIIKKLPEYIYMMPLVILPMLMVTFFNTRVAIYVQTITLVIICLVVPSPLRFFSIQFLVSLISIFVLGKNTSRSRYFITYLVVFISYVITEIIISLAFNGSLDDFTWINIGKFAFNTLLVMLTLPLSFVLEKVFGLVTDMTLLELSNTNTTLLRKLASEAPGTFQHVMQVADLCEEALYAIGGNMLLARTGAMYHDVGKLKNPMFFTENQHGKYNLHNDVSYQESSQIIINHVIDGVEICRKYHVPELIIDFVRTHHGTKRTEYFYQMALKENPDDVNEADFRYHGPIPFSKETAVLMMADAVEAASRSLNEKTEESISQLVEKIIDIQVNDNQFINTDLTFRDITTIKKVFKKKLMNIYHVRIAYPV